MSRLDLDQALREVLAGIGIELDAAVTKSSFEGQDPVLASPLRIASMASVALMAKAAAVAEVWRHRTGDRQELAIDLRQAPRRLCPFYEKRWELLDGKPELPPVELDDPFMPHTMYRTRDGRTILLMNVYPRLRAGALEALGCADDRASIATAVAQRDAEELEDNFNRRGLQATVVRTYGEFLETEQGQILAETPLLEVEKLADGPPRPFSPGATAPLDSIRALGMGRVIAGGGVGRSLALHGADVLNLWRPGETELPMVYCSAHVGMRSTRLNPDDSRDGSRIEELLSGTDVFFANRRPGFLERHGLDADAVARRRSGMVHCTVSLFGRTGPWANRIGFDQSAGAAAGVLTAEGSPVIPRLPEIYVVNDYVAAWLAASGCLAALIRRAVEGGSYRVHVSLARVALWLLSLGITDRESAERLLKADPGRGQRDPELFQAPTALGMYQGVTDQVRMSINRHVLSSLGSDDPVWLH